ncbi:hypothetical protein GZ77_20025 [Endozoicomonas montiporae]|uniref:Uncharacterized protein n=2 Tax=Endozoicomonas montiporae TaxID=1027273 RepID=A0A081N2T2_9GAMM|nr:hypothetical protein [Endozoicomonas montiporae]AMO58022.1 hypothetical protein EZMO1_4094 [Endozoicomonas montiporae CL-33]KEQ12755.1 hypothetical protein GZ77_20025 [Endozoicomonas montiporae]
MNGNIGSGQRVQTTHTPAEATATSTGNNEATGQTDSRQKVTQLAPNTVAKNIHTNEQSPDKPADTPLHTREIRLLERVRSRLRDFSAWVQITGEVSHAFPLVVST